MTKEQVARINELARKKKTIGLTESELEEQARLRRQYLDEWRENARQTLESVRIKRPDGTIEPLKKKTLN